MSQNEREKTIERIIELLEIIGVIPKQVLPNSHEGEEVVRRKDC